MTLNNLKVNYHIFENCNMKCKYCFRNKERNNSVKIPWKKIIDILYDRGIRKINIAGGEPLLYFDIVELLKYCKSKMDFVSIITNGIKFKNNKSFIEQIIKYVDVLGISVDSLDSDINKRIGRITANGEILDIKTLKLINSICINKNINFKINTVVSSFNLKDRSLKDLESLKIFRYKILENDQDSTINPDHLNDFYNFIKSITNNEIILEKNGDMKDTYFKVTSEYIATINDDKEYDLRTIQFPEILKEINIDKYNKRYNDDEKI